MSPRTQGVYLCFFVHESRQHRGKPLYEWLLQQAKAMDIPRGIALRAIADFGRRKTIHEQHFFELAGEITVRMEFLVSSEQQNQFLQLIDAERLKLPYVLYPVEFGLTLGDD